MTHSAPPPQGMTTPPRPFVPGDYMQPCAGEIATLGKRYTITSGGNQSRTWRPSKQRHAFVRALVLARDGNTCQSCLVTFDEDKLWRLHLDHIVPYRDGGLFYPANLQALYESCNCRKGARAR